MRVGASRSHLYDAQKTARARWEATADTWADDGRTHFDETVWQPGDQLVTDVLRAVDQLTVLFAQVRAECEFSHDSAPGGGS